MRQRKHAASRHVTRSVPVFHPAHSFAYLTQYVSPPDRNLPAYDTMPRQIPDLKLANETGMEYAIGLSTQKSGYVLDEAQLVTCI